MLNSAPDEKRWNNKRACLTVSFDCDYSRDAEAIPYVVDLFSQYEIKTSFACVGHWIEKYPDEHKIILEQGHEILNHTYSHPDNDELTPGRKFKEIPYKEKKEEISKCHDVCKRILKYEPVGCRIPHFKNLFTEEIYSILKELNYKYSSSTCLTSTKSKSLPYMANHGIIEIPLSTCPKHPFTVFDTWHSLNSSKLFYRLIHRTEEDYYKLFNVLIELGLETGSYINIYMDPYDVIKLKKFKSMLDFLKTKEQDLWITNYFDLLKTDYWSQK
ncbi:MAG: polysaccharide deacetylase family protein [Candidatus Omnitrophota bacterium]